MRVPGMSTKEILFSLIVFFTVSCLTASGVSGELYTLNTADSPPYSTPYQGGIYDKLIFKVFDNLGLSVKINRLPSARSLENVEVGIDDGEYARIKGLSAEYENIQIVDEKLIDFAFTAFSKDPVIRIDGWNSLKPYNVAFIKGWKIYETNVKDSRSVLVVSSEEELFNTLVNDRVDIILYERLRGLHFIKKNNIEGVAVLDQPLSTRGMYLYMNRAHGKLVPKIEQALKTMKGNGEYKAILDTFLR